MTNQFSMYKVQCSMIDEQFIMINFNLTMYRIDIYPKSKIQNPNHAGQKVLYL